MNRRYALTVGAGVVVLAVAGVLLLDPLALLDGDPQPEAAETPGLVYEGEGLTLRAEAGQVIEGVTDLEAGENVTVRLRSTGENPFLKTRTATVDDDGAFEASFDLSGAHGDVDVVVVHDGERVIEEEGTIDG